jgi:chromosome segregation ATPase
MAHGDHLAQFKADQLDAWERRLAQFSNRSDSTGYVGRIGVEVLTELRQTREQAEALATRAEQAEARVAELEELVTSLWMHKPGDCDACNKLIAGRASG